MNAHEAIAQINTHKLNPPNLSDLVWIIARAAIIEKNNEAINFLWLCHWRPEHKPN